MSDKKSFVMYESWGAAIVTGQNRIIKPQNLYSLAEHPIAASKLLAQLPAGLRVLMSYTQRIV